MKPSFFTRHCIVAPARISLACAFPPAEGLRGAETTVADISAHGIIRPLFTPTKADAVRLVIERNMEAVEAQGKGSEAKRRAATKAVLLASVMLLAGCASVHRLVNTAWPKPEVSFYHADTRAHAVDRLNAWKHDPMRYVSHLDPRTTSMRPLITGSANEWLLLDRYVLGQPVHPGLIVSFNRDEKTPHCLHLIADVSSDGRWMYVTGINNRASDGWHETATISGILREIVDLAAGR